MLLLIDIGNTRIKWATLDRGVLAEQRAEPHVDWTLETCTARIASGSSPRRVLVSNVGGDAIGALVREAVFAAWAIEPEFIHSSAEAGGVRNAYPEPAKLGVDRWLALIGAYSLERRAACVVSVGTAATIDGVDSSGRHLGGLIVPGPKLMVDSLLRNTSEIARRTEGGSIGSGMFANNTLGAVRQGAIQAIAALAERSAHTMQEQLQEMPELLLTGGAAEEVAQAMRLPNTVIPDLVLRGLAALATERPPDGNEG